jgi:hypothetical protein
MAAYMAYAEERLAYPEYRKIHLTEEECRKYLKKFSRHFKIPDIKVEFKRNNWGYAFPSINSALLWKPEYRRLPSKQLKTWSAGRIEFPKDNVSFGMVIHEFAHILAAFKYRRFCHHDRRFKRQLKRTYTFAKRYLINFQGVKDAA